MAFEPSRLGLAGQITRRFQDNPLTPILSMLGLLMGLVAVLITPQEEEPQIDVTMVNVMVPFPGAEARQVQQLVTWPLEQKLAEMAEVKHTHAVSRPGLAVLTVEFEVGVERQPALVRLYDKVFSNQDWLPPDAGVGPPLVKPRSIDDVPVMALTLWTDDPERSALELAEVAHSLETELKRLPGTRDLYTIGAPDRALLVELDAARLAAHGLTVEELAQALRGANVARHAGERVGREGVVPVTAGRFLVGQEEVAELVLGLAEGQPVRLRDVATVRDAADQPTSLVWHGAPPGRPGPAGGTAPAGTLAIAEQTGSNAADLTRAVQRRLDSLQGQLSPEGVQVEVTLDYGLTASDKARTLIQKLVFATGSVVLLVLVALGRREALVIGVAVVLTLALTLFASWAMGFTLNRVSLFALIFAIGILVDDAIVVVENIHRHMQLGQRSLREAIPLAVDEVGGPTILATFTVIAALMPMAFVSGLMGPYMRPIPINASVGMLLSLVVALVTTPWLSLRLFRRRAERLRTGETVEGRAGPAGGLAARLPHWFEWLMGPFLDPHRGRRRRHLLYGFTVLMVLLSTGLVGVQWVILKMLPFDNKSEFQLVVELPEGRSLEDTAAVLAELTAVLDEVPEVLHYQAHAGTAAPINFNGLVRQYNLREGVNLGDVQVNLVDRRLRRRQSHAIASALRPPVAAVAERHGAVIKVVEVPPGPPVLSPLVAELYGPDYEQLREVGRAMEERFRATPGIVDVDSTVASPARREVVVVDQERAARRGVAVAAVAEVIAGALGGLDASWVVDDRSRSLRPIRLRLPTADRAELDSVLDLQLRGGQGQLIPLAELVRVEHRAWDDAIHHKDLLPVVQVMADEGGAVDSPLYGMLDLMRVLSREGVGGQPVEQFFIRQPTDVAGLGLKWDGEWQITYETFRDMGLAYAVGMVLIYLLVVAYFRNYVVPLVIMVPIPLTLLGVMPGHAVLGAQFTATSMIGMIALAGIIVRNSILLVDFIQRQVAAGEAPERAVIQSCAVRAQPIALTALAAMAGAAFILDDPIFNGLAISLIFGILVSTVLTLLVIPLLYYGLMRRQAAGREAA